MDLNPGWINPASPWMAHQQDGDERMFCTLLIEDNVVLCGIALPDELSNAGSVQNSLPVIRNVLCGLTTS